VQGSHTYSCTQSHTQLPRASNSVLNALKCANKFKRWRSIATPTLSTVWRCVCVCVCVCVCLSVCHPLSRFSLKYCRNNNYTEHILASFLCEYVCTCVCLYGYLSVWVTAHWQLTLTIRTWGISEFRQDEVAFCRTISTQMVLNPQDLMRANAFSVN